MSFFQYQLTRSLSFQLHLSSLLLQPIISLDMWEVCQWFLSLSLTLSLRGRYTVTPPPQTNLKLEGADTTSACFFAACLLSGLQGKLHCLDFSSGPWDLYLMICWLFLNRTTKGSMWMCLWTTSFLGMWQWRAWPVLRLLWI